MDILLRRNNMVPVLEHIALSVADIERSILFYCNVLGFKRVLQIECPAESKLGDVVGLPGCCARIAKLESGTVILELFEYQSPQGKVIPSARTQADHGFSHIGFATDDIHADYERLSRAGVRFYGEPLEYRPGVWNVYFYGPDGETCELRQSKE
jgi:catechol 2,3-dioxygenase-like lactoylglutathione lyase family enzyme